MSENLRVNSGLKKESIGFSESTETIYSADLVESLESTENIDSVDATVSIDSKEFLNRFKKTLLI